LEDDEIFSIPKIEIDLKSVEDIPKFEIPKLEIPSLEDFNSRLLSKLNITLSTGTGAKDIAKNLTKVTLFIGSDCSSVVGSALIPINKCMPIPPEADNITLAVAVGCSQGQGGPLTKATGFGSMSDCESKTNPTFVKEVADGTCINAPTNLWGIKSQCGGWGVKPNPPVPGNPGPNDVRVAARIRYPDRRCAPGTGRQNLGDLRLCDVCTAEAGKFQKIDCAKKKILTFENPTCTGTPKEEPFKECNGLGIIRGIFSDEVQFGPLKSYGFLTGFNDGCYVDSVVMNLGVKSGACTQFNSPGGLMSALIDCETKKVAIYNDLICGELMFNSTFADNQCLSHKEINIRASCSGYQFPPERPKTISPSTSPLKNGETRKPSISPTESPTRPGETRKPTKNPTSPTSTPTKAPVNPTNKPTRTCTDIPKGCTGFDSSSCKGKTAKWTLEGVSYECNCVSSEKSSKVTFKLKVSKTTVEAFSSDACNAIDFYKGAHKKVYEKTKASIVSDYPVVIEKTAVKQGEDIVVEFAVLGFFDTTVADGVVSYINTNAAEFSTAIKTQAVASLGVGADVTLVDQAKRVDITAAVCGCDKLADISGSGAISNFMSSTNIIQAIAVGIVANVVAA